jgi:glycosyltransferase involved in cell wall biosynthesis
VLEFYGHTVIPFTAASESNLDSPWSEYFPSAADFHNPDIHDCYRYIYNLDARDKLIKLLDENQIDIAHLHIYYGKLTSSILSVFKEKGIPVVQTLHEYKTVCPVYSRFRDGVSCSKCKDGRFYNSLLYRCNRGSFFRSALTMIESYASKWLGNQTTINKFIAISDFLKTSVVDMGLNVEKVTTINNFVTHIDKTVSVKSGYVVYAGRFERNKGVWTLLDVAAALPDITFKFAGHGGDEKGLKNAVKVRGLTNVEFQGFLQQDDLKHLIRAAIACVVPSEWDEPFGLAVVESMALGTPVIASRIGGISEIIENGHDGFLCSPGSVDEFVEAVSRLASDKELVKRLAEESLISVNNRFSSEIYYCRLMEVYSSLVD